MFDLIKKLTSSYGVSGNEEEIKNVITKEIENNISKLYTDTLGNLICIKEGKEKTILVTAHMDEPGIINTYIDEKGFIRFGFIGNYPTVNLLNQRVKYKNNVIGVILTDATDDTKTLKQSNLYIDIGANSREEAEKLVSIGDTACIISECIKQGDFIISKALDNRVGLAILINTIKKLSKSNNTIYFVFTTQEFLGQRGAKVITKHINYDMAINIDLTPAGDELKSKNLNLKCGNGPAIKIKDQSILCHTEVKKHLEDVAKKNNIPYQYEINETIKTDAGAYHLSFGGIKTGGISIPCRNLNSTNEMVNINDLKNAQELLLKAITT